MSGTSHESAQPRSDVPPRTIETSVDAGQASLRLTPEKLASMCSSCGGTCCQYFTVMIDAPQNAEDFDEMRWWLAHPGHYLYLDEDQWHLNVESCCRFLDPAGRCLIYDHRPNVCRGFGHEDECEFDGTYDFQRVFRTIPEIEAYAREVLAPDEFAKMPVFPHGHAGPS